MDYLKNLPDYIHELFTKIARENGFENFTVQSDLGSNPGDGYGGEILSIKISEEKSDRKLDLVCKIAPFNRTRRMEMRSDVFFRSEALWYNHFAPIFEKFQTEHNLPLADQFRAFPKCYATLIDDENERYVIVLEDLRPLKFEMWNKAKLAPIENLRLTLTELGKLHGLSIAFKNQRPAEFAEFKEIRNSRLALLRSATLGDLRDSTFDRQINALKRQELKNIARHLKANCMRNLEEYLNGDSNFSVLCHGDCWNNNLLYRFDEQGIATDIRFLDWQMVGYASPCVDLAFYLFSTTDQALRDAEFDNLMALYHASLAKTVKLLGSDPEKLFTFENLKSELKKCGEYALLVGPIGVLIGQASASQIPELNEAFEKTNDGGKIQFVSDLGAKGQLEFERRLNEMYEDIIKRGYLTNPRKID